MKSFPAALLFSLVSRLSAQSISAPLPPLAFTGEQDRPQLRNGPRQQRVDGDPGRDGPAKGQAKPTCGANLKPAAEMCWLREVLSHLPCHKH